MTTANSVIEGAFGKAGIYQPEDSVPPEDTAVALTVLIDYLNGMNGRGAVFPSIASTLAAADDLPVADENIRDLKWALALELASQFGKVMNPIDLRDAMNADRRFVAAHTVIYAATPDAGLRSMPSTSRIWR